MKKAFMFVAVALVAFAACQKEDGKKDGNDGKKDNGVEIKIDGAFADWDAIAATKESEAVLTCQDLGGLKAFKATSNDQYIFCYAEIGVDKIQTTADAKEGGNSNDGHGKEGVPYPGTPGPLTVYLDLDGTASTGFLPHANEDGDACIAGIGCEAGIELYLFIDSTDGKCKLGWSQLVYEPDGCEDGMFYQESSWWGLQNPNGGWAPDYDNIAVACDATGYATEVGGGVAKVEFAIGRSVVATVCKRGHEMGDVINLGARYYNADQAASWGLSGLTDAATLKLK